jgi:transmembrane sensor
MIDKHLIQKYFDGACNAEELALILGWLNDDNQDHAVLREMMMGRWEGEESLAGGEELKIRLLSSLQQRLYPSNMTHPAPIQETTALVEEEVPARVRQISGFYKYGIAASIAGLLFLGYQLFNHHRLRELAAQWRSVANTSAKMKFCMLPDSTGVWLDPKSTLSWQMSPDEGAARNVRIEGQAFFNVNADKGHPFIVFSGPLITRVLGTAFNIEAYPDEKDVRISLVSGKIALQRISPAGARRRSLEDPGLDSAEIMDSSLLPDSARMRMFPVEILKPGEMLTYVKKAGTMRRAPLKMADLSDWTSGHLVFSEVPVRVALERLAKLYHFTLRYQNDVHLEKDSFSTVFTREETPTQMIRNILFITQYTYRINGNEVEIVHK